MIGKTTQWQRWESWKREKMKLLHGVLIHGATTDLLRSERSILVNLRPTDITLGFIQLHLYHNILLFNSNSTHYLYYYNAVKSWNGQNSLAGKANDACNLVVAERGIRRQIHIFNHDWYQLCAVVRVHGLSVIFRLVLTSCRCLCSDPSCQEWSQLSAENGRYGTWFPANIV
jgi:hypothetical protein